MPLLVEYFSDERLCIGLVTDQGKKKLNVTDARGRSTRVSPDKVLYRHTEASIVALERRLDALQRDVDVPLLWESLVDDGDLSAMEAHELARLYFDDDDAAHCSAMFRALHGERLHFRRRGRGFEPRSADDLTRIRAQLAAEERRARENQALDKDLRRRKPTPELRDRIERFLRLGGDRALAAGLEDVSRQPMRYAFDLLVEVGHLPPTADLEVLQNNLQPELPGPVIEYAAGLIAPATSGEVVSSSFSIDDPDTLEVDDALGVSKEGDLIRVDIDIADVASMVKAGDPVDREALKRASTIYLPTHTYFMLPGRLGCDLLSLEAGEPRPAVRTSAWLDPGGKVVRYEHRRVFTRVEQRLDYDGADRLIAEGAGDTAAALHTLRGLARVLADRRRAGGSISFRQREWKLHVSEGGETISALPLRHDSPSRDMIAEMMILNNTLAARFASERELPIIYRVQPPPTETPPDVAPDDPAAFSKLRHLLQPASLSVHPSRHWGLGVDRYTQASSPLRRYTDLVIQRQLHAAVAAEPPPYEREDLLRVLAAAEATEREAKRMENTVKGRWALEFVSRLENKKELGAWVLDKVTGGWLVALTTCGARGLLMDDRAHEPGEMLMVDVKTLKPRRGIMRLLPSD